jgi:hypothetical protein
VEGVATLSKTSICVTIGSVLAHVDIIKTIVSTTMFFALKARETT